jgi:hypothetical protein
MSPVINFDTGICYVFAPELTIVNFTVCTGHGLAICILSENTFNLVKY